MELETESTIGESVLSVTVDSNRIRQLNTEGQNGCSDLGLGLEQVVSTSPSHGAEHNHTSEVNWGSMLASEKVVLTNEDENNTIDGPEPNILPLIDVGLGRPPMTDFVGDNVSSLSVIANYGTSSESDSDSYSDNTRYFEPSNVVTSTPTVICSNPPVEYRTTHRSSSDDSDSDSESSEDESSSSGSSTDGASRNVKVAATKVNPVAKKNVPGNKGEVTLEDLPPIEDLQISVPENACIEIGSVSSIVDQQVIIQAKKGLPAMDLGTVLFLEKGKRSLGEIFDVFGQVTEPFYSVRFNSAEHVQKQRIEKGMTVFCAPRTEHTNYVFLQELMQVKGTDASWEDNNEPPPQCIDYSDDEEERTSLRTKRSVDKGEHGDVDFEPTPRKRVNSFERRMNERNLRKSALIPPETRRVVGRGVDLGARRQIVRPFVKSQFGWNQCGRGRPLNIAYGVPPMQHPMPNQRMGQPMNFGPMQPGNLSLPPQPNSFGPIQPPSHIMSPQANGHPCALMGVRPSGPPTEYRSARRQPPNLQPPNLQPSNLQPPMHPPNSNGQPMGYVPAPIRFSYIPPVSMMDNSDGQFPQYGVLGFMSPQTFQNRPRNIFSSPPPGFPPVPGFANRIRPRSFPAMYGQLPPMFYPEFQPPQLPPGAMPNALASLFTRPPPPNGGV